MPWVSAKVRCEKCGRQWRAVFEGSCAGDSPEELECDCGHMTQNTAFEDGADYVAEDGSEYPKSKVLEEMV